MMQERFLFRDIKEEETAQAVEIEQICFPPHEACSEQSLTVRIQTAPEYRGQGLGKELVCEYIRREREKNRKRLFLTCLDSKVGMYEKWGFVDHGIANSTWGGEEWHEMSIALEW